MASRDIISSMHLFLEMKNKFPDLPEDTIRNYVSNSANDREKCTELLQKECMDHFQSSKPFTNSHLPDSSCGENRNARFINWSPNKTYTGFSIPNAPADPITSLPAPSSHNQYFPPNTLANHQMPSQPNGRSSSHAGVVCLHGKPLESSNTFRNPVAQSAPALVSHERPFTEMYKHIPISSHGELHQNSTSDHDNGNRMMFSTTKEHIVSPPGDLDLIQYSTSPRNAKDKKPCVQLNIIPASPFQQQQFSLYNNSVCTTSTSTYSSKPGRHTTSLNFQVQKSSEQHPLEISTTPTDISQPCNHQNFGSHVQVLVGPQVTTITAMRLQRPQGQNEATARQLSVSEQSSTKFPESSQDVKIYSQSVRPKHSPLAEITEAQSESCFLPNDRSSPVVMYDRPQGDFRTVLSTEKPQHRNTQVGMARGYQKSQAYMEDVINHQKARLDLLFQELNKEKCNRNALKDEVTKMEKEASHTRNKNSFTYAAELQKLREETRKLQIEVNCLYIEKDMATTRQKTDDDFYSNIFTGPNGTITTVQEDKTLKENSNSSEVKETCDMVCRVSPREDDDDDELNKWRCKKCTFDNHPALKVCEMCSIAKSSGSFFDND